jgi:hypothetical protein
MKWNTKSQWKRIEENHYRSNNDVRFDFFGKVVLSPVNGAPLVYYSHSGANQFRLIMGYLFSFFVFSLGIAGTLVSLAGIYYARYQLRKFTALEPYVQYIASGGTGMIIIVYSSLFSHVCGFITNYENHRTDYNFQYSVTG